MWRACEQSQVGVQPAGDAPRGMEQEMECCAAPVAPVWDVRFHSSAWLCELQWQLRDKEVIYKQAELILCVSNLFPFSCASPKSPLLQKLILGETFVRAQKVLSLGGSQDNECHKLLLKAWLFIHANICVLQLKALWMILLNRTSTWEFFKRDEKRQFSSLLLLLPNC